MSTKVVRLQQEWRNFAATRSRAKRELQEKVDANKAEMARLQDENAAMLTRFDEDWKAEKARIQEARDIAVMEELATGRPAQAILKEIGSNNTVWIYELRARVQAASGLPEPQNLNTPTAQVIPLPVQQQQLQQQAAQLETVETAVLEDVRWLSHNHQGVVGWLISEDHTLTKKYGAPGTEFEGEWFICETESKEFQLGNQALYDITPKAEITRRSNMLASLLDESYKGRVKLVDNPYTS